MTVDGFLGGVIVFVFVWVGLAEWAELPGVRGVVGRVGLRLIKWAFVLAFYAVLAGVLYFAFSAVSGAVSPLGWLAAFVVAVVWHFSSKQKAEIQKLRDELRERDSYRGRV